MFKSLLALVIFFPLGSLVAHGDAHDHGNQHTQPSHHGGHANLTHTDTQAAIKKIAQTYQQSIAPLFKRTCFDCHGTPETFPWYYRIPGIKQLIDRDIAEARQHLDMRQGYPFISHASPEKDLEEIAAAIVANTMPLFLYRLSHRNTLLTDDEKKNILHWIEKSRQMLTK